ncbi:acylphosphatase [Nocardioides gansuensis]|uniref:acylphosphatase n=1 Tax=Nocardioides gansuensis TaxID=2138300 RepID=UPI003CCBA4BB
MTATDLTITGRVQGVSFRYYTQRAAERLGVAGWVRNEPDGSVAVHAEGPADAVQQLVAWCHEGPPGARVERVDVAEGSETGAAGFGIRY